MTSFDLIGKTLRMRRPHSHREPSSPVGSSWRTLWLTVLACGLFGLAMVMVVVVLASGPRPVDEFTRPGSAPVPPAAGSDAPPKPPAAAPRPESPPPYSTPQHGTAQLSTAQLSTAQLSTAQRDTAQRDTAQPDGAMSPNSARELARQWTPGMVDGFTGVPAQ